MKKLRRPATREEAEQFGTTMKAVFEELGIARGATFVVARDLAADALPDRRYDGETTGEADVERLDTLMERVKKVMTDGQWHTLPEVCQATDGNAASVSARIRDLRKEKFGGYEVERRDVGDGVHVYRVTGRAPGTLRDALDAVEPEVVDAVPVDESLFEGANKPLSAYHPDVA